MQLSVQLSVYPLGQADLTPAIEAVWRALQQHGLTYKVGPMSTLVVGDDVQVFAALHNAFIAAVELGGTVMVAAISNACIKGSDGGGAAT